MGDEGANTPTLPLTTRYARTAPFRHHPRLAALSPSSSMPALWSELGSTFVAGLLSCLLSGLVAEESTDPKDLVTEECKQTKCAGAWSAYMEVRPLSPSPSQLFAPRSG